MPQNNKKNRQKITKKYAVLRPRSKLTGLILALFWPVLAHFGPVL
jgi:hypothetical protein